MNKPLINWDNPVVYFHIGIVCISIAVIMTSKPYPKKQDTLYSIDIHDGDSVIIYKKNNYSHNR